MENQVLSAEQMQELIDMGIDTSNASMYWTPKNYLDVIRNEYDRDAIPDLGFTYAFTLQDILEILPKPCYLNCIDNGFYQCEITTKNGCAITNGTSSLNAAFNMLKWCKENKYI